MYRTAPSAAISSVTIRLSDFTREAEVEGTSSEQVDAIAATLATRFDSSATMLGGSRFRFTVAMAVWAIALALSFLPRVPLHHIADRRKKRLRQP